MHILAMGRFSVWMRLLREYGVDPKYRGRMAGVLLTSALTSPLRLAEQAIYGGRVRNTPISSPPLMVLGYARSGTTHLHNVLAHDPNHGSVTTLHCLIPDGFLLVRALPTRLFANALPAKRPMDNVSVAMDLPQEEEMAIGNKTHMSVIHNLSYPSTAMSRFQRYGLMDDLSERERRQWGQIYLDIVRKATFDAEGRRIVLKSTTCHSRLRHLLRVFPQMKFVHIIRNPFEVYVSLMSMIRKMVALNQMVDVDWDVAERGIIDTYTASLKLYIQDRSLIPSENLVEVRFEDLERDAMGELRRVYQTLDLGNWDTAEKGMSAYLATLKDYRKNRYEADPSVVERVTEDWGFALDEWNYELPS